MKSWYLLALALMAIALPASSEDKPKKSDSDQKMEEAYIIPFNLTVPMKGAGGTKLTPDQAAEEALLVMEQKLKEKRAEMKAAIRTAIEEFNKTPTVKASAQVKHFLRNQEGVVVFDPSVLNSDRTERTGMLNHQDDGWIEAWDDPQRSHIETGSITGSGRVGLGTINISPSTRIGGSTKIRTDIKTGAIHAGQGSDISIGETNF